MSSGSVTAALATLLTSGLVANAAWGEPAGAPVALSYTAGLACPDEAAFRARVTARAPVAFGPGAERALTVAVSAAGPVRGRLLLEDHGASVVREVTGATCDEVVSALALIAAVLLEGGSETAAAAVTPSNVEPPTVPAVQGEPPNIPAMPAPDAQCPGGEHCCPITGLCYKDTEKQLCAYPPDGASRACLTNADCIGETEYCSAEGCDGPGGCKPYGECGALLKPVCGCDNQSYVNAECAASKGVRVASDGECK